MDNKRFDFALSFAGSERELAERLFNILSQLGFKVFYDKKYEHEMIGIDGSKYLRDIYANHSKYCVVLISKEYDNRYWTDLERESIQSRELLGEKDVLLPVIVDDYKPSWLPASRIYFDLKNRNIEELINLLCKKVDPGPKLLEAKARTRLIGDKFQDLLNNKSSLSKCHIRISAVLSSFSLNDNEQHADHEYGELLAREGQLARELVEKGARISCIIYPMPKTMETIGLPLDQQWFRLNELHRLITIHMKNKNLEIVCAPSRPGNLYIISDHLLLEAYTHTTHGGYVHTSAFRERSHIISAIQSFDEEFMRTTESGFEKAKVLNIKYSTTREMNLKLLLHEIEEGLKVLDFSDESG